MSKPLLRRINREQMLWRAVDVEQRIGEDHPARAIWELVGRLQRIAAEDGQHPKHGKYSRSSQLGAIIL